MEKRAARVSEAQWCILLDFLERNPNLARAKGYNNSARGRVESLRLWQEVANLLNAEGSGTTKTPKEWSIYISNYKSKLKKNVADINCDAIGTGGGPPRNSSLSDVETRFLAILGPRFGQAAPQVSVNPFAEEEVSQPSTSQYTASIHVGEHVFYQEIEDNVDIRSRSPINRSIEGQQNFEVQQSTEGTRNMTPAGAEAHIVTPTDSAGPQMPRQTRLRHRPLAPLDECMRIMSRVEEQRAAADAATAHGLDLIGQNLGRLADVAERYLAHLIED